MHRQPGFATSFQFWKREPRSFRPHWRQSGGTGPNHSLRSGSALCMQPRLDRSLGFPPPCQAAGSTAGKARGRVTDAGSDGRV